MKPERPCAIYYWALHDPHDPAGGFVYFGITYGPEQRWRDHVKHAAAGSGVALHGAIRKHGRRAFKRSFQWLPSRAEAARQEQLWIAEAKRRGVRTYNMNAGGDSCLSASGRRRSPSHKTGDRQAARDAIDTYHQLSARLAELEQQTEQAFISALIKMIEEGVSGFEASRRLGASQPQVSRVLRGLRGAGLGPRPVRGR